jgi:hypothetical protein
VGQRHLLLADVLYTALIDHIVSYGFIVVGANTSNVGTGKEMLQAVDWALAQDQDSSSPIYGRVDRTHIGGLGHSQGGEGTVMVGADSRIRAIAPLSGAPLTGTEDASVLIQCPTFYVTTQNDIATPSSIHQAYEYTPTPSVFGVTDGGNHDEYTNIADDPHVPGLTSTTRYGPVPRSPPGSIGSSRARASCALCSSGPIADFAPTRTG